ncbi:MAG: hypothetical protein ACPGYP_00510 [Solirubrobacterales bacterium]
MSVIGRSPQQSLRLARESGQAGVELLAALPVIALVALSAWQLTVAGHTWWRLTEAARVAAREAHVGRQRGDERGGRRQATALATAVVGGDPARQTKARFSAGGKVSISARVPLVGPFALVGDSRSPRLTAQSGFAE